MSSLFSMLSENELNSLTFIREYATENERDSGYSHGTFCDNQYFLRFWEKAKSENYWMNKMFGDNLILTKTVQAFESKEELENKAHNIYHKDKYFILRVEVRNALEFFNQDTWNERNIWIKGHQNYRVFSWDVPENSHEDEMFSLHEVIEDFFLDSYSFIENTYDGPTITFYVSPDKSYTLTNGAKYAKAFTKVAKCLEAYFRIKFGVDHRKYLVDLPMLMNFLEEMRIDMSMLRNQQSFNTKLCLSIHPLDYLTASYNENDWRSCMHIYEGEYRRGVVEMMNSPYVVVAYTPSAHEFVDLGGGREWNSKKWREFFIVSPKHGVFGIKGYPYWNKTLEDATLEWMRELIGAENFKDNIINYAPDETTLVDDDYVARLSWRCGPAMYNDFYGSEPRYRGLFRIDAPFTIEVNYSGASECMICGEDSDFDGEGYLSCYNCIEVHTCCICGETIPHPDYVFDIIDGREYCEDCYSRLPCCNSCGDIFDPDANESDFCGIRFGITDNNYNYALGESKNKPFVPLANKNLVSKGPWIQEICQCEHCAENNIRDIRKKYMKDALPTFSTWFQTIPLVKASDFYDKDTFLNIVEDANFRVEEYAEKFYDNNISVEDLPIEIKTA